MTELEMAEQLKAAQETPTESEEVRFIFQMINHKDGRRSEPFITTWDSLHETLANHPEEVDEEDYILLVAVLENRDTKIPPTPLIKVKTFLMIETGATENG